MIKSKKRPASPTPLAVTIPVKKHRPKESWIRQVLEIDVDSFECENFPEPVFEGLAEYFNISLDSAKALAIFLVSKIQNDQESD
jgi:hypothetical protein